MLKVNSAVILCDGNEKVGLGHFYRCLHLSHTLFRKFNIDILWVGDIADEQVQYLKSIGHQFEHRENLSSSVTYVSSLSSKLAIVDSYSLTSTHLEILSKYHEVCVIDDFGLIDSSEASTTINFTVDATNYTYNSQTNLLGPEYFLCDERLSSVRRKNLEELQKPLKKSRILIAIGGHDRLNMGPELALLFAQLNKADITLLGRYDQSQAINSPNINSITFTQDMSLLYHQTDLVISGGGLTKYESAYCAIPNIVLAQTQDQYDESVSFEEKGLCFTVGTSKVDRLETTETESPSFNWSIQELLNKADEAIRKRNSLISASKRWFRTNSTLNAAETLYKKTLSRRERS